MEANIYRWSEIAEDTPIALLSRRKFEGVHMLVAKVSLKAGCQVAKHHHISEQFAIVLSGRVKWTLGEEDREFEATGGDVVHLPPNEPHSVYAIEDTEILDVLSPPGPMGIDAHTK